MVLRCFRPFVDEHLVMVYDLKKIRFEYFATDFVYDLVAAVPWDLIYTYSQASYSPGVAALLRLPKMLRLRIPWDNYMAKI